MRKILSVIVLFSFMLTNCSFLLNAEAAISLKPDKAGKSKGKKNKNLRLQINGSILNSSKNTIETQKLSKDLLKAIKRAGIENVSVLLTRIVDEGESTDIYTLGSDGVELRKNRLVLNLFANLLNAGGAVVTAASLPTGEYRISVLVDDDQFAVDDTFDYSRPVVVTGTVDSCNGGGTQQVSEASGDSLSQLVALSSDCLFINEVTADNISSNPSSRILNQEDVGTSDTGSSDTGSSDTGLSDTESSDTGSSDAGSSDESASSEPEIAISEAVTNDGEESSAPVELDNAVNQEVEHNEETDSEVDQALSFVDTENPEETQEALQEVLQNVEEGSESAEPAPDKDTCATSLSDILVSSCQLPLTLEEIQAKNPTRPEDLEGLVSSEEFLTCGQNLVAKLKASEIPVAIRANTKTQIQPGAGPLGCIPSFVFEKIIPNIQTEDDFIKFAVQFIFNAVNFGRQGPNPKQVCSRLEQGLAGPGTPGGPNGGSGMGAAGGQLPPPCVPPGIREIVKNECPELLSKLPENQCNEGARPCSLGDKENNTSPLAQTQPPAGDQGGQPPAGDQGGQPPAGDQGGQPPAGDQGGQPPAGGQGGQPPQGGQGSMFEPPMGCIEDRPAEFSDLCKPCQSDSDCKNPVRVLTPSKCLLPGTICGDQKDPFGNPTGAKVCILETLSVETLTAKGADLTKQSTHKGGAVDPFICKEHPFNCGNALPPPPKEECIPFVKGGEVNPNFNAKCCFDVKPPSGGSQTPVAKIHLQITPPAGGDQGGTQPPPCDPLKDPNCKPPTGDQGGTQPPPCDPLKDPNCKPPTGDQGGQPPVGDQGEQPPLGDQGGQPPTGGQGGPIGPDPRGCFCIPENFDESGNLKSEAFESIKQCFKENFKGGGQGQGGQPPQGGQGGQGQGGGRPGQDCIRQCKDKCGDDRACLEECGKQCRPGGQGGDQGGTQPPPCDPTVDPNCKPPIGGDQGGTQPPPCDPTVDPNCKPPIGGDQGGTQPPPCDPLKDPNCKPPTGGDQGGTQPPPGGTGGACPQESPFKCQDGRCVKSSTECGGTQPPLGGTGGACPQESPFKCQDGRCVKSSTECGGTQPPPGGTGGACPQESPFKCQDGRCVKSSTECGGTQPPPN